MKLKTLLPFIILFALFGILWRELFYAKPNVLPSTMIGESVPSFKLPILAAPQTNLTEKALQHKVSLLNVWATWCYACSIEAPMLMKIKKQYHVPIYSIAYKDDAQKARQWLNHYGNPYVMTGMDNQGDVAIDLGVYGTPETFLINSQGKIIYRHIGIIDQEVWDTVLYPLIKKYEHRS